MNQKQLENLYDYRPQGKRIIACSPLYPPLELFHSMDMLPIVLWGIDNTIPNVDESSRHVQNYVCSVGRHLVEFVIQHYDLIDAIFSYNACDTLRNIPEILKYSLKEKSKTIPWFHCHIPMVLSRQSTAESYLKKEIHCLIQSIEKTFHVSFDPDKFKHSVKLYQQQRMLIKQLEGLTAQGKISFKDFTSVAVSAFYSSVEEHISHLKKMIDQSNSNKARSINYERRLVLSGILPPYKELIDAIESNGMLIAANDIAMLTRSYNNVVNADLSIGDYYVHFYKNHFPCSTLLYTLDGRLNAIFQLMEQSNSKGFITIGEKFCEYEYFDYPYLNKHLKAREYNTLFLEIAICDNPEMGSFTTRLESFIENFV